MSADISDNGGSEEQRVAEQRLAEVRGRITLLTTPIMPSTIHLFPTPNMMR